MPIHVRTKIDMEPSRRLSFLRRNAAGDIRDETYFALFSLCSNLRKSIKSFSHPSIMSFKPKVRMRHNKVLYPFNRSPFKYASRILRSAWPSISFRTIVKPRCYSIVATFILDLCHNIVAGIVDDDCGSLP
jgi:hypothetical protein